MSSIYLLKISRLSHILLQIKMSNDNPTTFVNQDQILGTRVPLKIPVDIHYFSYLNRSSTDLRLT